MSLPTQSKPSLSPAKRRRIRLFKLVLYAILGTLMFTSKLIMEAIPNIHLLGMLIMVYTLVFRWEALIPIYVYVLMDGVRAGFNAWWVPYLYIWTILWSVTMLLPKRMPKRLAAVIYSAVCTLYGLLYGVLYAPAQALIWGLDFHGMLLWIAQGISFDILHGVGNLVASLLILPLSDLLGRLMRKYTSQ